VLVLSGCLVCIGLQFFAVCCSVVVTAGGLSCL